MKGGAFMQAKVSRHVAGETSRGKVIGSANARTGSDTAPSPWAPGPSPPARMRLPSAAPGAVRLCQCLFHQLRAGGPHHQSRPRLRCEARPSTKRCSNTTVSRSKTATCSRAANLSKSNSPSKAKTTTNIRLRGHETRRLRTRRRPQRLHPARSRRLPRIPRQPRRFFVRALPLGKHNLSYRLRAEIPGKFSALPRKPRPCMRRSCAGTVTR